MFLFPFLLTFTFTFIFFSLSRKKKIEKKRKEKAKNEIQVSYLSRLLSSLTNTPSNHNNPLLFSMPHFSFSFLDQYK